MVPLGTYIKTKLCQFDNTPKARLQNTKSGQKQKNKSYCKQKVVVDLRISKDKKKKGLHSFRSSRKKKYKTRKHDTDDGRSIETVREWCIIVTLAWHSGSVVHAAIYHARWPNPPAWRPAGDGVRCNGFTSDSPPRPPLTNYWHFRPLRAAFRSLRRSRKRREQSATTRIAAHRFSPRPYWPVEWTRSVQKKKKKKRVGKRIYCLVYTHNQLARCFINYIDLKNGHDSMVADFVRGGGGRATSGRSGNVALITQNPGGGPVIVRVE